MTKAPARSAIHSSCEILSFTHPPPSALALRLRLCLLGVQLQTSGEEYSRSRKAFQGRFCCYCGVIIARRRAAKPRLDRPPHNFAKLSQTRATSPTSGDAPKYSRNNRKSSLSTRPEEGDNHRSVQGRNSSLYRRLRHKHHARSGLRGAPRTGLPTRTDRKLPQLLPQHKRL